MSTDQEVVCSWIQQQLVTAAGECRRLLHGRGGCFAGFEAVVVDWFAPVAIVRLYQPLAPALLQGVLDFLQQQPGVQGVVLQQRGRGRQNSQQVVAGEVADTLQCQEQGLRYQVYPLDYQNTGLFLDMRAGRQWVRSQAAGKRVLNLFAYTCGFSVAAIAGGATAVVNVDMSRRALSNGRINHQLNGHELSRMSFIGHDIFKSWGRIRRGGPYDLVVIDPPSFQPGSFVASKDYGRILARLVELTCHQAQVLVCHNDPAHDAAFIGTLMQQTCPTFRCQGRLPAQPDFPDRERERGVKGMMFERYE